MTASEPGTAPTTRYVGLMLTVGGIFGVIANVMHPRYDGSDVDTYQRIAGSATFLAASLFLTGAMLLITVGLVGLADHVGLEHPLAHAGRITALVGGTIAVVQAGIDVAGVRAQAITFTDATAADHVGAFWATNSLDRLSSSLFALWTVILLGLTPLLLSLAVLRTARAEHWLRHLETLGAIGGLTCVAIGVVDLVGHDQVNITVAFIVGSSLVTLWILGTGWMLLTNRPGVAFQSDVADSR